MEEQVDQRKWLIKDGSPLGAWSIASRIRQLLMSISKMTVANKKVTKLMKPAYLTA
jgi:hypothetical protein